MVFKNDKKLTYMILYSAWILCLLIFPATEVVYVLGSLTFVYLTQLLMPVGKHLIAELLIVLSTSVGLLLHIDSISIQGVMVGIANILIILLAILFFMLHDPKRTQASPRTQSKDSDERQKLVALINSMADGVVATDPEKKVTIYNGAALDVLNVNVSLEGRRLSDLLELHDEDGKKVDIFKLAHGSRTSYVTRDLSLKYPDGDSINLYLSIAPVTVGYGQKSTLGYIILLRDITKEKTLEEERDEFISVVSHELRTPVTVAEGSISNAQFVAHKEDGSPGLIKSLEEAHRSAVFLADMINDLSMLSRAERGVLQVDPESIDIQSLLEILVEEYKLQVKQKGLKIQVESNSTIKPINSAPLYVKEILQNFITNSIKYTQQGTITLSAKQTESGVDVIVRDTGIGISKSDQKKLFDKFFRSEDYRTRQSSGTGLGLYVTLKLAQIIGAKIDVKSELNVGSEFVISIPNIKSHHRSRD
jgi:two-component system phosphate regulon sensor histidine kinase PhoR